MQGLQLTFEISSTEFQPTEDFQVQKKQSGNNRKVAGEFK